MTNEYYDALMALKGADELKDIVKSIHFLDKTATSPSVKLLSIANMLWVIKNGGGVSTMISLFSDYLSSVGLHEFIGEAKFIEFKLGYNSPDENFTELKRLYETIIKNTGHRYEYKGILCVNIDEWCDKTTESYFLDFLEFIDFNHNKIKTIFTLHLHDKRNIENIEAVISSRMRLETIIIKFPEVSELLDFIIEKYIKPNGFSLSNDAQELLFEHIKSRMSCSSFDGFKNIERLAEGILLCAMKSKKREKIISANILSSYCEKHLKNTKTLNRLCIQNPIGFSFHETKEQ